MATIQNVIDAARSLLGYNTTRFWGLYNQLFGTDIQGLDWCAATLRVVGHYAGISLYAGYPSNWVPTVRDQYISRGRYYTSGPSPGDIIFYAWSAPGKTYQSDIGSHVGIIIEVNGNNLVTIEGNLSGECKTTIYHRWTDPDIIGVGRPEYSDTPTPPPPVPPTGERRKMPLWFYLI